MIVEDFVMLGRTVPEPSKRHGLVVCSAGYSRELKQFLRVYPITMLDRVPRWSQCRIALKRNPQDSRIESWRLQNDGEIPVTGKTKKADEFEALAAMASNSIAELNDKRASLGILKPSAVAYRFDGMKRNEEYLLDLFPVEHKEQVKPRIEFADADGDHDLQLRDWGAYEFLRKNADQASRSKLWDALKFTDESYEHLLFVGNHNQHRNSWLVIGVISDRTKLQQSLFDQAA